jgi:hypothetical protein
MMGGGDLGFPRGKSRLVTSAEEAGELGSWNRAGGTPAGAALTALVADGESPCHPYHFAE